MNKISVIIPTFNNSFYIKNAIESVLNQTYRNYEVIVIDDGSTDNTKAILDPYIKEGKIKYIFQENKGVSTARNTGIRVSNGQFIKFLDSDDYLFERQLELQVDDVGNHDSDISITNYEVSYSNDAVRCGNVSSCQGYTMKNYINNNQAPIHAYLVKKEPILKIGYFDEKLTIFEDYDLWMRLILAGAKVSQIDYIGCCYRIYEKSMYLKTNNIIIQKVKVFEKLNKFFIDNPNCLTREIEEAIFWVNVTLVHKCFLIHYPVKQNCLNLLKLTTATYIEKASIVKRVLSNSLGFGNYLYLQFLKYILTIKNYKRKLLYDDTQWRNQEYKA